MTELSGRFRAQALENDEATKREALIVKYSIYFCVSMMLFWVYMCQDFSRTKEYNKYEWAFSFRRHCNYTIQVTDR